MAQDLFPVAIPNQQQYGYQRVEQEPHTLFYDPFETLDTVDRWTTLGTAPAVTNSVLTMASSTTAAATSQIVSKYSFAPVIPGFLQHSWAIKLDASGAAVTGAHRFWGFGTAPATPATTSAATKLTDAIGFELDTDGKLYASVYQAGVRIFGTDLSATGTGAAANKQMLDGAWHRYICQVRTDRIWWFIEDINNPVAAATFMVPNTQVLPLRVQQVNNVTTQTAAPTLLVQGAVVADTASNHTQIADGTYQWRKATVSAAGGLSVTTTNPTTAPETGLAKDATLTGGTVKAISRGGAKGITTAADVTTTAEGADHQALDMQTYHGGTAIDPRDVADRAGRLAGIVTANAGTNLNTSALALDATLTGGTAKAIGRGGAKGTTAAADITSTAEGANNQALDIQNYHGGVAIDPRDVTDRAGRLVGVVDTELPAAAALADGAANPTSPLAGAAMEVYNNATWDRMRGNFDTTTGDTGAKTATFAGATQTNYNARGAYITIRLGTVSGTTPTLAAQLQFSPDAGTTWLTLGPAMANLTTTSQTGLFAVYPTNTSQAAGSAPAVLTSGASAITALNIVLPRTWRLNYVIGGTLPSFAITAVNVNYVL